MIYRYSKYNKDTYVEGGRPHLGEQFSKQTNESPELTEKELEAWMRETGKRNYEAAAKRGDKKVMEKYKEFAPTTGPSKISGLDMDDWITKHLNMDRDDNSDTPFN